MKPEHRSKTAACILSALLLCFCLTACRSGPQERKAAPAAAGADNQTGQRLIADYAGMQEDDIVSWAWIDPMFRLDGCSSVSVAKVLNYSRLEYPWAQERIYQGLSEAAGARRGGDGPAVTVTAAITAMKEKPGLLRRFSPSYDDTPSIELELVIAMAESGRAVVKLNHMARAEELEQTVDGLIKDITAFLNKKL